MNDTPRNIAIVHEWLTGMRGGEKCVEAMCEVFPDATVHALVHVRGSVSEIIERRPIRTSFIQHLPQAERRYRHYLPLFPAAVERFDMSDFDLVISSNHCVAKGVKTAPHTLHLCYCYTPMRYIWEMYDEYFGKGRAGVGTRTAMRLVAAYLRRWDVRTSRNPHAFIAISNTVRQRIQMHYRRPADVIYPPVDTEQFQVSVRDDGYFLIVSALVPYKRVDLAIDAFNQTGWRLVIVGSGPEEARLKRRARSNIEFVGWVSVEQLPDFYKGCRALIFPGEEDFGIVPLEAMASGKPVVALARGGALETVIDTPGKRTGILFHEQSVAALVNALHQLERTPFDPDVLRAHARAFDRRVFKEAIREYVRVKWREFVQSRQP